MKLINIEELIEEAEDVLKTDLFGRFKDVPGAQFYEVLNALKLMKRENEHLRGLLNDGT